MSAFPGLKNYFDICKKQALNRGYVLHNSITGHKSFIEYFDEFKQSETEFTRDFWTSYRYHKENDTSYFHSELLPKVRNYFKRKGSIERMAQNYPIQGSSSSITKLAAYYFYKDMQKKNLLFRVLISNQIHDEILVECPIDISKEVANSLIRCMEYAGSIFCKTIKLKADYKITDKWEH
jgi:DNA polymerase I-like protein with 3'-5' exonuclease and polymerase domains